MKPSIFVSSPVHESVLRELNEIGTVTCGFGSSAVEYDDIKHGVDAVLLRAGAFTAAMMDAAPSLKIVARHGAGVDSVDIDAATTQGIWVTNTPGANSQAVAEHVFALILALGRKVPMVAERVRRGLWGEDRMAMTGIELAGRTIGLLGYGSIGKLVANIARGFAMKVIVSDPALQRASCAEVELVSFEDLLARADILSLHVPLLPGTRGIIDAAALACMGKHAILINTGRGGLIDEDALVDALRNGMLGGAALDVLDAENIDMVNPIPHARLCGEPLDNLLVTPHVGGQTEEALIRVGQIAVEEIRRVLSGRRPAHAVNAIPARASRAVMA